MRVPLFKWTFSHWDLEWVVQYHRSNDRRRSPSFLRLGLKYISLDWRSASHSLPHPCNIQLLSAICFGKLSCIGTQSCSLVYLLPTAAFALPQENSDRKYMAHEAKTIYYLLPYRSLLTPTLVCVILVSETSIYSEVFNIKKNEFFF